MRSSPALLAALLVCTACPSPAATSPPPSAPATAVVTTTTPRASVAPTATTTRTCDFIGARFVPLAGSRVQEHRGPGEPYSRISLEGFVGTHGTVISIIPREMRSTGDPTKSSQAQQYFQSLRTSMASRWSDVRESSMDTRTGSHPMILGRAVIRGPLGDRIEDDAVLLLFPADFPAGKHFYVFFWTDIHRSDEAPNALTELQTLVESFEIRASPAAPAGGCA